MRTRVKTVSFSVTADKIRGKARPRFGRGNTYKEDGDEAWEQAIRDAFIATGGGDMARFADEVRIIVQVRRKLPKSAPKRVLEQPDIFRPDLDNICKSVLDALNRVAFRDDNQVTALHAEKMPRTRRADEILNITVEYVSEIGVR